MTVKVYLIESEAGWGQRVDETREFESHEEADKFIAEFNAQNNKPYVPSWYMYAEKAQGQ